MNFKKSSSWVSAQFFQPNCIYLRLFCLAYLNLTILQVVAFLLIGVATYGKGSAVITSLPILGGIVASGVFLLFVAVLGLLATLKHHQVWPLNEFFLFPFCTLDSPRALLPELHRYKDTVRCVALGARRSRDTVNNN